MMVNVQAGNAKLKRRAAGIVMRIAKTDEAAARTALEQAGGNPKLAVLICAGARTSDAARRLLDEAQGNLRVALLRAARE